MSVLLNTSNQVAEIPRYPIIQVAAQPTWKSDYKQCPFEYSTQYVCSSLVFVFVHHISSNSGFQSLVVEVGTVSPTEPPRALCLICQNNWFFESLWQKTNRKQTNGCLDGFNRVPMLCWILTLIGFDGLHSYLSQKLFQICFYWNCGPVNHIFYWKRF